MKRKVLFITLCLMIIFLNLTSSFVFAEDNLIQGRNYILDSARTRTLFNDGTKMLTLNDWFYIDTETAEKFDGQTVTISFDYDCDITSGKCFIALYHNWNNIYTFTSDKNGEGHFAVTKTLGDVTHSTNRALYLQGTFEGSISISNVKLEIGDKSTAWTPAREDPIITDSISSSIGNVNDLIISVLPIVLPVSAFIFCAIIVIRRLKTYLKN